MLMNVPSAPTPGLLPRKSWVVLFALAALGGAFVFRPGAKLSLVHLGYDGTGTNRYAIFQFTNGTTRSVQVLLADPIRAGGAITAWYLLQTKTQGRWAGVADAGRPVG